MRLLRLFLATVVSTLALAPPVAAQLSFEFTYTDTNNGFNDPTQGATRRSALEAAAQELANQLPITNAVTITFEVSSNNVDNGMLAGAGSGLVGEDPGFYNTVAHQKVLTGEDGNGAEADGQIEWNFFHEWDYDNDVAETAFDFISTAMHEILHAIGFISGVFSDGTGLFAAPIGEPDAWFSFDRFLVASDGTRLVSDTFVFNSTQLGALSGGSSLFFNGPNAIAANGGNPVVIYSPDPWEDGSSGSHTDDATYTDDAAMLMNAIADVGPGIRTLSEIELGILQDLGFEFVDNGSEEFAYLVNLSVRTLAGSGAQTLIAGFAVAGGEKPLLIRGIGPTLTDFDVNGALADPRLGIFNGSEEVVSNDDWLAEDATVFQQVGAFALPDGSADAAVTDTAPIGAFTAQVTSLDGTTGIALAEIYDTALPSDPTGPRLTNVSARSQVGTGAEVLVAGFVIGGSGTKSLLIRGIGPTLADFGVNGALADPQLTLFRSESGTSTQVDANDNWDATTITAVANRVGAFNIPSDSNDAALLVNLVPGAYTVQLSGVNNGTGVGLIEVYDAD